MIYGTLASNHVQDASFMVPGCGAGSGSSGDPWRGGVAGLPAARVNHNSVVDNGGDCYNNRFLRLLLCGCGLGADNCAYPYADVCFLRGVLKNKRVNKEVSSHTIYFIMKNRDR